MGEISQGSWEIWKLGKILREKLNVRRNFRWEIFFFLTRKDKYYPVSILTSATPYRCRSNVALRRAKDDVARLPGIYRFN